MYFIFIFLFSVFKTWRHGLLAVAGLDPLLTPIGEGEGPAGGEDEAFSEAVDRTAPPALGGPPVHQSRVTGPQDISGMSLILLEY